MRILAALALILTVLLVRPGSAKAQTTGGLTLDALRNATYTVNDFAYRELPETVALIDGDFIGPPVSYAGIPVRYSVRFDQAALSPDFAAVILLKNDGGSGTETELHIVTNGDGTPVDQARVLLGDNYGVKSLRILGSHILIDGLALGPTDSHCCASMPDSREYSWESGALKVVMGPALSPLRAGNAGLLAPSDDRGAGLALLVLIATILTAARKLWNERPPSKGMKFMMR